MSEDKSTATRRIILPQKQTAIPSQVSVLADAPTLLNDALSIIAMEIVNLKAKTGLGKSLDLAEARVLTGYIKALTELSRELRERDAAMDLANMSDADIIQLVQKLQKKTEAPHGT